MNTPAVVNISEMLEEILVHIVLSSPVFSHIRMEEVAVCMAYNRNGRGATYGKLVPMRFEGGSATREYRGKTYRMPDIYVNNNRLMYIIYFYMPRFFDLSALDKLEVIFHELYHISPEFDGDIRRMGKRKIAHGHSRKQYNSNFTNDLHEYYQGHLLPEYRSFLNMKTRDMHKKFGKIEANMLKVPRPQPVDGE